MFPLRTRSIWLTYTSSHAAPFEPPPYRGLSVLLAPPHPLDEDKPPKSQPQPSHAQKPPQPPAFPPTPREPRERSETMSTSSESYQSSGTTEGTSPSIADWKPASPISLPPTPTILDNDEQDLPDVQMHPTESKRVSLKAQADGMGSLNHPLPCEQPTAESSDSSSESSTDDTDEPRPSCILLNALHVTDIFDLEGPRFRSAKLPQQINLRNLNIQQIKYATISDVVIYGKNGVGKGVLEIAEKVAKAQEELWNFRMADYYTHVMSGSGEGVNEPVRYGVWVVVGESCMTSEDLVLIRAEPFHKLVKHAPHLINLDHNGNPTPNSHLTDLFEREAKESRDMTRGSEVLDGFWVGNDCDVPGGADDGAGSKVAFDLCVRANECSDMPSSSSLSATYKALLEQERKKQQEETSSRSWVPSPATIALRNLLSPSSSSNDIPAKRTSSPESYETSRSRPRRSQQQSHDEPNLTINCAGSCRTINGQMRPLTTMSDKIVELVYFLRKLVEGRDRSGLKRKILVHCQDGYTESSILVLAYIMSSLSVSLPEAFLHLQLNAKRSFFLYPSDKPLLRKVDARLTADRRAKALKLRSASSSSLSSASGPSTPTSPTTGVSKWRSWVMGKNDREQSIESLPVLAREVSITPAEQLGESEIEAKCRIWFDDRRFDGFPSRILPFLYLGNL